MDYYYKVTEQNVDGCGGDAEETVVCNHHLTAVQLDVLQRLLRSVKQDAVNEGKDYSTGDIIEEATRLFSISHGITVKLAGQLFYGSITF